MDDLEQMIKEKLLENLIDKMSDKSSDRMKPKGLAVEVAAPSKDKLAEGLEKAKGVLGSMPAAEDSDMTSECPSEEEDEQRLMDLLAKDDDDDDEYGKSVRG